ncbi:MAG: hypothetical protein ACREAG_00795 [Nitrosopumilaceae archaeon]
MAMEPVLGGLQWRQLLTLINQRPGTEQIRPGRRPPGTEQIRPGRRPPYSQSGSDSNQGNFGPYVVPGIGPVSSAPPTILAPPGQPTIPSTNAMSNTPGLAGNPNVMFENTLNDLGLFERGRTSFFQTQEIFAPLGQRLPGNPGPPAGFPGASLPTRPPGTMSGFPRLPRLPTRPPGTMSGFPGASLPTRPPGTMSGFPGASLPTRPPGTMSGFPGASQLLRYAGII